MAARLHHNYGVTCKKVILAKIYLKFWKKILQNIRKHWYFYISRRGVLLKPKQNFPVKQNGVPTLLTLTGKHELILRGIWRTFSGSSKIGIFTWSFTRHSRHNWIISLKLAIFPNSVFTYHRSAFIQLLISCTVTEGKNGSVIRLV